MIIGTAGHVDHGKTALVRALTGVDTDRLPEEKRRGITLELGFAHLDLPGGRRVGVIDVPGHERFVKAMAAGAGGVDVALLVVAADEGVMPQTREHVDICALLGVRRGVLVVTKADLLPGLGDGWLELLDADLRALVAGTFLEGAPLVAVSAKTGEGLDALKAEIARAVDALAAGDGPAANRSTDGGGAAGARGAADRRSGRDTPAAAARSVTGAAADARSGRSPPTATARAATGAVKGRSDLPVAVARDAASAGGDRRSRGPSAGQPGSGPGDSGAGGAPARGRTSGGSDAAAWRSPDGPLFLPVDRAFTLKGFGLVLTGTLLSGRLSAADAVALLPGQAGPWRVRGLQVHGRAVDAVSAGERVAVNLPDLEVAQVHRGMALVRAGELPEAKVLDVELSLLPTVDAPLPRRTRRLVTLGTAQVEAAVRLVDVETLRPGEACFAQLRFAAPVAAIPGQRFIVRGTRVVAGRGATVGGGRVLALNPPRRRRGAAGRLEAFATGTLEERVALLLTEAGYGGLTEPELFARASGSARELGRALEGAAARQQVLLVDKDARRFLARGVFDGLVARALAQLERFHADAPEKDGMPREELRQRLGVPHDKTFQRLLAALSDAKRAEATAELVRLPGRGRAFDAAAKSLKDDVAKALATAGLAPPLVGDLAHRLRADEARVVELLKVLVAEGRAVRAGELYFDAAAVKALEAKLVAFLATHERITTQQFKDLTGQSRKFVIPLAEYFDREKVTLRVGETRVARRREG
ncbi:MAG: SelB C-terminal domain-containing protein [Myxococcota bacterium]